MNIRLITKTEEFKSLQTEWNALLAENHIQSAILSWEWLFSWWEVFGTGKSLWIVTAWEADTLLGVAPLMIEKRKKFGIPLKVLRSLAAPKNDVGGYLIKDRDSDVLNTINAYIFANQKAWHIFELNEFREDSLELTPTKTLFWTKDFLLIEKKDAHYYVPVTGSWDEYYSTLSAKFRKNLRRAQRNSQKLGAVENKYYLGKELSWQNLEKMIEVNCHAHFPTICNSPEEKTFLENLYQRAPQWLFLYMLYIDGQPIAYEYGFVFNKRLEDWRAGFDTRIDPSVSVGKFGTLNVLQDAFESEIKEVDFMRGAHSYKREWKPSARNFVQLRFFRRQSLNARIAYLGLEKIKPFLKKKNP